MGYISISPGNKKMGLIPSVSMPPDLTCSPFLVCYNNGCYAMKMMKRRDNIKRAWTNNLFEFNQNPQFFEDYISRYIKKEKPERFRWHVGGEIPSIDSVVYIDIMTDIAKQYPDTDFLMFTKMYSWLDYMSTRPDNFSIIVSLWPNELPVTQSVINGCWKSIRDIRNFKIAWLSDDPRIKSEAFNPYECRNSCTYCGMCWKNRRDIVFHRH